MIRALRIHPGVAVDVIDIREYYEAEQIGLGERFSKSLDKTYDTIIERPAQFGRIWQNWRSAPVKKFPYLAVFRIDRKSIYILSVHHVRRHDRVWRKRV
jgi:hypothetical protein